VPRKFGANVAKATQYIARDLGRTEALQKAA